MAPVIEFDAAIYGGSVAEILGETGLAAMTGFQTMASEGTITMPNFRQWTEQSEFVAHKQRHCEPGLPKPMGRLWRHMMHMCTLAPCHEVIHLLQGLTGQAMNGQLAEHDGYYSTMILGAASMTRDPSVGYAGMVEYKLLGDVARIKSMLAARPPGWDTETYTAWRDSFGAAKGLWNDRNFDGPDGLGTEFLCGSTLSFEAACCDGECVDEADPGKIDQTVQDMLRTMFENRTSCDPGAEFDEQQKRLLFDCNGKAVNILPMVDLSKMSLEDRLVKASVPASSEELAAFVEMWDCTSNIT